VPEKFDEIRRTVELRRAGDFVAASEMVLRNRGTQAMDDIRRVVRTMIQEENFELAKRTADQRRKFRVTMNIFWPVPRHHKHFLVGARPELCAHRLHVLDDDAHERRARTAGRHAHGGTAAFQ
jgi:hypothetical protein